MKGAIATSLRKGGSSKKGFSLLELVLVLGVLALVLVPLVAYTGRAAALQGETSWFAQVRSRLAFQDQVLVQGVEPQRCISSALTGLIEQQDGDRACARQAALWNKQKAGIMVVPLSLESGVGVGSVDRAFGLELRASESLVVPDPFFTAGAQRVMNTPGFLPSNGSLVLATHFVGAKRHVRISSSEGGLVVVELRQPALQKRGLGVVDLFLSVEEFAAGLEGEAWVEWNGVRDSTQEELLLADGRKAWLVEEAAGSRKYMPSEKVALSYRLSLGRPILVLGGVSYLSGKSIPVDYRVVTAVRSGADSPKVRWSEAVEALFASAGVSLAGLSLEYRFQAAVLASSQLNTELFAVGKLQYWRASALLQAIPLVPKGCKADPGYWYLMRVALVLPEPKRGGGTGTVEDYSAPGSFMFSVDELAGVGSVGRLSARNGRVIGTGGSLELEVYP